MWLFNCITGLVSEIPLAMNLLTSSKSSWNVKKRNFIQIFYYFEQNWVRKSYFSSDLRFYDCLITSGLPTTCILVVIERIYRYQFKNIIWKTINFCDILVPFLESTLNLQFSQKKRSLISQVFLKLLTPKWALI